MTRRQAKKIIKQQVIRCRSRFDGPEDIITGGSLEYSEGMYRAALLNLQRRMNRETANPKSRSIARCNRINMELNRARLALLIGRMAT